MLPSSSDTAWSDAARADAAQGAEEQQRAGAARADARADARAGRKG